MRAQGGGPAGSDQVAPTRPSTPTTWGSSLRVDNVAKAFGGNTVLCGVSFDVGPGITVLLGPNGAGKTTLFNIISGALRPGGGTVSYGPHRLSGMPSHAVARASVGRMFQDVRLLPGLTVLDNVRLAATGQIGESLTGLVRHPLRVRAQERALERQALGHLATVGLADYARAPAGHLSYGQGKRLAIARLLQQGARVMLLDEPAAGLDPEMARSFAALLRSLCDDERIIVVVEHNLDFVQAVADRVLFLDGGRIVVDGLPSTVLADEQLLRLYFGITRL